MEGSVSLAHIYHLADHAPVTEAQLEAQMWADVHATPGGIELACPSCGVTLELRHEGA